MIGRENSPLFFFLISLRFQSGGQMEETLMHKSQHTANTAIPYRESTGFLQGSPCVVILPLHALAVYRV